MAEIAGDPQQWSRLAANFPDSIDFPFPGGSVSEIQGPLDGLEENGAV